MTEPSTAPTTGPATTDPATPDPAAQGQQQVESPAPSTPDESDTGQESPNSEAARYRIERNEARAERDNLAGRLATMQRRACESAVADLLEQPADLWDIGHADVAEFFSDADELDTDVLRGIVGTMLETRPGLAKQKKFDGPRNWGQGGAIPPAASSRWSDVVRGR